jgi:RNA polymerase sigma-70 factor (ECF subfamily)
MHSTARPSRLGLLPPATRALAEAVSLVRLSPGLLASGLTRLTLDELLLATAEPSSRASGGAGTPGDRQLPPGDDEETQRLVALVDLAKGGDAEAFGQLYDHYVAGVYRFCHARVSDRGLAEDLTSETFFRALRSIGSFTWQGKNFGAWLTTIARNLVTDHYKSSRARLESVAEDVPDRVDHAAGTESQVLASLTSEALADALRQLATEQQECVVMRFCQGLSIAETAAALGRSEGAVKQLQLRAVRNLAKLLPAGVR